MRKIKGLTSSFTFKISRLRVQDERTVILSSTITQRSLENRPEDAGVSVDRLAVRVLGQIVALGGPHDCEIEE